MREQSWVGILKVIFRVQDSEQGFLSFVFLKSLLPLTFGSGTNSVGTPGYVSAAGFSLLTRLL